MPEHSPVEWDQRRTAGSARCMRARPAPRSAMLGRPCMSRFSMMMKLPLPRSIPPASGPMHGSASGLLRLCGTAHTCGGTPCISQAAVRTARTRSQRTKVVHLRHAKSLCVCRVLSTTVRRSHSRRSTVWSQNELLQASSRLGPCFPRSILCKRSRGSRTIHGLQA